MDHEASAPDEAELLETLQSLQRLIFKYPMAIQAAFSALVAEGRRYAETAEGGELLYRLARTRELPRARMIWEVLSLSAFTEQSSGPLPSVFVDTLVRTLKTEYLEPALAKVFERRG